MAARKPVLGRAGRLKVERGKHARAKKLVLVDVRSWPFRRSEDYTGLSDNAVIAELVPREVDFEAPGESVPVVNFVFFVAATDVSDEQITSE